MTAGFSAGQLTAALVGIPVGRWLDRHGPRGVMTAGSPLTIAMAFAPWAGAALASTPTSTSGRTS